MRSRLIILSAFLYSCLLLSCVQYVKDLYGLLGPSGGKAGLEPVLAAGLDTLIPIYRVFIEQNCRQAEGIFENNLFVVSSP